MGGKAPAATARRTRVRQHPEERRKQLIGIGLDMLTRRPLHQVTIDEVAAQAGISRSLLFHYFPTKRDYYAEVVRAASRRLLRATRAGQDAVDQEDTLDAAISGYLAFIERRHEAYLGLFRSAGTDDWVHEIFLETRAALVDRLLGLLGRPEPAELVRTAVGSWLSFAEDLSLQHAQNHLGNRDDVVALLAGALREIVTLAERSSE
ncbi:MAG: TetR/AcrR family transcriptional regulator [Haloechinothrix sp.]